MSPTDHTNTDPCFPPDRVRALLLGRGTSAAAAHLARHISGCPRCAAVAEAVGLDSDIVSDLRREHLPPPPFDYELADVVARVSRIDRSSGLGSSGPAPPLPDLPGRLGPYRLVEFLGAGGMGAVYRAEDTALHRFVAVKVVKGGVDTGTRARFLSEARALAAVRHDNVVTVYYVGEEPVPGGPVPYLAMELLEGQTLRDWMAAAPPPSIGWVVRAGRQIAAGLAFAHDAGLVHRDVKPANLWLEAPQGWANRAPGDRPPLATVGRIKLLDFGLAHPPGVPAETGGAGTPAYMAPEQARGEAVDARSDLFGLGCVLYELCTGELPFPARARRWFGDREAPPAPVRSRNPAVPERLADLIARLLSADRGDRPASARAVELELAGLDAHTTATHTMSGRADTTVAIRPRRRLLVGAAVLALVGTVTIAGVARSTRADTAAPAPPGGAAEEAEPQSPEPPTAPLASDTIDDEWYRTLATRPPQQQLNDVLRALGQLNPKYDWAKGSGWVEYYGVIRLTVNADEVTDLRPVRALTALSVVRCRGSAPGRGVLTDLSPLSELKLKELHCRNNPGLRNLTPIRLDGLEFLDASFTGLDTLAGLTKAPLVTIKIAGAPIRDLGPVRKLPRLRTLDCTGCPITDFRPLTAAPLRELSANVRAEDAAVLNRIKTLEKLNGKPVKEFWKQLAAQPPK
ncbi:MAG TPA: protein kinase [Gemmata sp.]